MGRGSGQVEEVAMSVAQARAIRIAQVYVMDGCSSDLRRRILLVVRGFRAEAREVFSAFAFALTAAKVW